MISFPIRYQSSIMMAAFLAGAFWSFGNLDAQSKSGTLIEPKITPSASFSEPTNAALLYWRAFASMPKLTDEEQMLFRTPRRNADADEFLRNQAKIAKLVEQFSPSLTVLHRAVAIPQCDWGLEYSLGPAMAVPHLSKAVDLGRAALIRARLQLEEGKFADAVDDLRVTLQLSRHAALDGLLISSLVDITIESSMVYTTASGLSKLDNKSLEDLSTVLATIPPRLRMIEAIRNEERCMVGWMRKEFGAVKDSPKLFGKFQKQFFLMARMGEDPEALKAHEIAMLKTSKGFEKAIEAFAGDFSHLVELLALPYDQAGVKADTFLQSLPVRKAESPISALVLPSFTASLSKEMHADMHFAMLRAAVAIRLQGSEAITSIKDPLTKEPFEYRALEDGFELKSRGLIGTQAVSITFR